MITKKKKTKRLIDFEHLAQHIFSRDNSEKTKYFSFFFNIWKLSLILTSFRFFCSNYRQLDFWINLRKISKMNNDYKMLVMATTEQEEKVTRGLKKRENNWWREMMRKWESAFFIEKRLIVSFPDEKNTKIAHYWQVCQRQEFVSKDVGGKSFQFLINPFLSLFVFISRNRGTTDPQREAGK